MVLRRLWAEVEPKILWADAICIKQSDNEKKAQKVSMMLNIYLYARIVYSWLGEAGGESDRAIDFLSSFEFRTK